MKISPSRQGKNEVQKMTGEFDNGLKIRQLKLSMSNSEACKPGKIEDYDAAAVKWKKQLTQKHRSTSNLRSMPPPNPTVSSLVPATN